MTKLYWHVYSDPPRYEVSESTKQEWVDKVMADPMFLPPEGEVAAHNISSGDTLIVRFVYDDGSTHIFDCRIRRSAYLSKEEAPKVGK